MKYEDMSDFEINCRVHAEVMQISGLNSFKAKDYCNNPSDAWPVITENKISIMFDSTDTRYEGEYHEWCDAISSCQKFGIQHQSNPLRAAMIVFLKMRETKK